MKIKQAEAIVVLAGRGWVVSPDLWYRAMAVLMAERGPA